MSTHPALAALFLALLSAVSPCGVAAQEATAAGGAAKEPPIQEKLSSEITVFEAQLVLDAHDLGFRDRQRLRPEQILLLEGGAPRRVTNLQPLAPGAWRTLIYIDAPLSRARTVRLAALELGGQAQRLTDLGTVEVIVADPEPRTVFGPSRESPLLARKLAELGESGLGSDELHALRLAFADLQGSLPAEDPRRADAHLRELELVRRRADHLLLRAAEGCAGDPCLLFLVSDGFYEDPAPFYFGEGRLAGAGEARPALDVSHELALAVAAYEWIAFPLPLRESRIEAPIKERQQTDFDVFLDHTGAVRRAPKAADREPDLSLDALEVSVAPILQPLQRMALWSSGRVVRIVEDMEQSLDALDDRRRLFYLTDRLLDGEARPVIARLVDGGAVLRTPAWVRSSTPPAVASARIRALLAGGQATGDVPLTATLERDAAGQATIALEARWGAAAELTGKSTTRVSVGYARAGEVPWVGHQRLAPGTVAADGVWRHRLAVPLPPGVERVAVVAESLLPRSWGAAVLER